MATPAPFRVPDVRRALKVARDLGLRVTGYKIGADGSIDVQTAEPGDNSADAAVEAWKRGRDAHR